MMAIYKIFAIKRIKNNIYDPETEGLYVEADTLSDAAAEVKHSMPDLMPIDGYKTYFPTEKVTE
jgi:DNA-dependent RNA polymerase auxiliary subunit epsilon